MTLHAASMIVVFMDTVQQAPTVVQCAPEPTLKWLLPTIVQTLVSLLSIGTGVGIVVWSFRRNRQSEHEQWTRNQSAEHDHWLRDQSKAEWKDLLLKIAEIEHRIPIMVTGIPDHTGLESIVMGILPLLRGTLFIYPVLETSGYIVKWQEFLRYVSGKFSLMTGTNRSVQLGTLGDPVTSNDRERLDEINSREEMRIRNEFHTLLSDLRTLAHRNLDAQPPTPSS
jgi:hypothetical protein